jgi:trypsin
LLKVFVLNTSTPNYTMSVANVNVFAVFVTKILIISTCMISSNGNPVQNSSHTDQPDPAQNVSTMSALFERRGTNESQGRTRAGGTTALSEFNIRESEQTQRSLSARNPSNEINKDPSTGTLFASKIRGEDMLRTPRIVDGTRVPGRFDFPYYAWTAGAIPPCGGTLIWPDIILTSASCQDKFAAGINVGGLFLDGRQSEFLEYVEELLHPQYDATTRQNDLMLVKLNTNSTVLPVQLNFDAANDPASGDGLTILGFGATVEFGDSSENLLQGDISAVSQVDCDAYWSTQGVQVDDSLQICAGSASGSPDFCEGDEGGPILSSSGAQVGIISFTDGCGRAGTPGVYTRIR